MSWANSIPTINHFLLPVLMNKCITQNLFQLQALSSVTALQQNSHISECKQWVYPIITMKIRLRWLKVDEAFLIRKPLFHCVAFTLKNNLWKFHGFIPPQNCNEWAYRIYKIFFTSLQENHQKQQHTWNNYICRNELEKRWFKPGKETLEILDESPIKQLC